MISSFCFSSTSYLIKRHAWFLFSFCGQKQIEDFLDAISHERDVVVVKADSDISRFSLNSSIDYIVSFA